MLPRRRRKLCVCFTQTIMALNVVLMILRRMHDLHLYFRLELQDAFTTSPAIPAAHETFSSCLLVMDDNHRLDEWIAYHYHVLPMRHLVIAVDPHSATSPTKLLDRWRPYLTIEEWTDRDFTNASLIISANDTDAERYKKHDFRQGTFYHECIRHLRSLNRTWTTVHDIDEFFTLNSAVIAEDVGPLMRKPGAILSWTHHLSNNITRGDIRYEDYWYKHFQRSPCVTLARVRLGAVESSLDEIQAGVPDSINATRFDTLRWRYRATGLDRDGMGKSIIDVSRVVDADFNDNLSPHFPLQPLCSNESHAYDRLPIGIHHYLGSWESYTARNDARKQSRRWKRWHDLANGTDGGVDDEVREWIVGFVEDMGRYVASSLLEHAGELQPRQGIKRLSCTE